MTDERRGSEFGLPAIAASLSPGPALSHSRSGFTRYAIAAAVAPVLLIAQHFSRQALPKTCSWPVILPPGRLRLIAGCCARAASGQTAAAPPSKVMNSRRFILDMGNF